MGKILLHKKLLTIRLTYKINFFGYYNYNFTFEIIAIRCLISGWVGSGNIFKYISSFDFSLEKNLSTISKFIYCSCDIVSMDKNDEINEESPNSDKLQKDMLKPITKAKSELDEELKELEVENSGGGKDGGGG